MTVIDKKQIEFALQEAKGKKRWNMHNPMSEAAIEARACIDCFEFVLKHCQEIDGMDRNQLLATKVMEAFTNDEGIECLDYDNTFGLVTHIWLFLTDERMPEQATIDREAFFHEVAAMIDTIRSVEKNKIIDPHYILVHKSDLKAVVEQEMMAQMQWSASGITLMRYMLEYYDSVAKAACKRTAYSVVNKLLDVAKPRSVKQPVTETEEIPEFEESIQHADPVVKANVERAIKLAQFGKKIEEAIKMAGLTKRQFAVKMGKHASEISRWCSGEHNFTIETIVEIENCLGINLINIQPV